MNGQIQDLMRTYRARRDEARQAVREKYDILGFISSGTYGRVYKAQTRETDGGIYAIKKFKPDKEGEVITYTGISQSACREIALNREMKHENVIALREVMLEEKSIYMVFEYAEHDFLQIIHHHAQVLHSNIQLPVLKSLLYQLIAGVQYLHTSHILHRDLKPANILVTSTGIVKIGDLGLARLARDPLLPLFNGDKVVVTIWYRAPELLMGARHYTKAVDCWAIGCIFAELISLRPIFKGEEAKLDAKKNVPFQKDQMTKILEVMGTPDVKAWPGIQQMPEFQNMRQLDHYDHKLTQWCTQRTIPPQGIDLLRKFLIYNPDARLDAKNALEHAWFLQEPKATKNAFQSASGNQKYPLRRVTRDEAPGMLSAPPSQRSQPGIIPPGSGFPRLNSSLAQGNVNMARKKARME